VVNHFVQPESSLLRLVRAFRVGTNPVGWTEVLVATLTGTFAILIVYLVSNWLLNATAVVLLVASMGSSAVLLFAVPHGTMSQPWPLFGGHLLSAVTGVTCAVLVPEPALAAGLAVGLSVGGMQLLRCVHAPGGATALAAALGGPTVYGLGYLFVLMPLLLNVAVLFVMAVLANYPFAWRRYPAALAFPHHEDQAGQTPPSEDDLAWAIRQMNVIVDVTAEELHEIAERALEHARNTQGGGITLNLGPRFVRARNDEGWILHKALTPQFEGHRPEETVRLNLVMQPNAAARSDT
jgi:CBS domain-containing membrane protein